MKLSDQGVMAHSSSLEDLPSCVVSDRSGNHDSSNAVQSAAKGLSKSFIGSSVVRVRSLTSLTSSSYTHYFHQQ